MCDRLPKKSVVCNRIRKAMAYDGAHANAKIFNFSSRTPYGGFDGSCLRCPAE